MSHSYRSLSTRCFQMVKQQVLNIILIWIFCHQINNLNNIYLQGACIWQVHGWAPKAPEVSLALHLLTSVRLQSLIFLFWLPLLKSWSLLLVFWRLCCLPLTRSLWVLNDHLFINIIIITPIYALGPMACCDSRRYNLRNSAIFVIVSTGLAYGVYEDKSKDWWNMVLGQAWHWFHLFLLGPLS